LRSRRPRGRRTPDRGIGEAEEEDGMSGRSRGPEHTHKRQHERLAIVDGSNVAYGTTGDQPRIENIRLVRQKLEAEGYRPVVVVDAALRHHIDDPGAFERMLEEGKIQQAPAGTDADYFILSVAKDKDAYVVSNDRFRDREDAFPDATRRVIRFMIVEGDVVLEKRTQRRD
jgi:hypothetical protein